MKISNLFGLYSRCNPSHDRHRWADKGHKRLKSVFKYFLTLAILVFTGYSQVFAQLYKGAQDQREYSKGRELHAPVAQTTDFEAVCIEDEEEDQEDKSVFRKQLSGSSLPLLQADLTYVALAEQFQRHYLQHSSLEKPGTPYPLFRVLRL